MRNHRSSFAPSLLVAAFALSACGGDAPPVASVEVTPRTVRLGYPELQEIRMTWSPAMSLGEGANPTVFVHLLDEKDEVARTFDHPFPRRWREGETVQYDLKLYQSALGPPLPAGRYRLTLGLYEPGGKRWALDGLGEPIAKREYVASEVEVVDKSAGGPSVAFSSESWLPVEVGGDRQVLGRRWLSGTGALRFQGITTPGKAWMVIRIPASAPPTEEIRLEGGSNTPAVLVSGSCGNVETNLTGSGYHEVELPVETVPQGGVCDVVLRPNFRYVVAGLAEERSASLENIAWAPGAGQAPARPAPGGEATGVTQPTEPAAPDDPENP